MTLHHLSMPLGIVIRKAPGVTRWARWSWRAVAVVPGAPAANWVELRREGEAVEYHAATVQLDLWSSDTEAYLVALASRVPGIAVVMRQEGDGFPQVVLATASPYEAQDYQDDSAALVSLVPMTPGLIAWTHGFVQEHHREEVFIKRRRDRKDVDLVEDGIGDPRVRQAADVFRAPRPGLRRAR